MSDWVTEAKKYNLGPTVFLCGRRRPTIRQFHSGSFNFDKRIVKRIFEKLSHSRIITPQKRPARKIKPTGGKTSR